MIAAIRVRGTTGVRGEVADTMKMLRLNRINHAVILDENPSYKGMLQKSKDYITWGEINEETLTKVITKRGRLPGGDKVTEEFLKENTSHKNIEDVAKAVFKGEKLEEMGIKPVFRLHPPRKGFKNVKKAYNEDGTLGYRGEDIENLIGKML
ncbi:MAG TPA: 50S ribosomal protein L30 [Methanobacterium sp.]|jgi:large subunit ribosomal protein L30|nr:MAG: 50S ribosomal protein L30 [Methanobacterium sp.]HOI70879.1 50S ribosomal protein L30 [Methanobacterium sp.]HPX78542.1 50S ribosomal protein L30 [Methanobacterium sp.]